MILSGCMAGREQASDNGVRRKDGFLINDQVYDEHHRNVTFLLRHLDQLKNLYPNRLIAVYLSLYSKDLDGDHVALNGAHILVAEDPVLLAKKVNEQGWNKFGAAFGSTYKLPGTRTAAEAELVRTIFPPLQQFSKRRRKV